MLAFVCVRTHVYFYSYSNQAQIKFELFSCTFKVHRTLHIRDDRQLSQSERTKKMYTPTINYNCRVTEIV